MSSCPSFRSAFVFSVNSLILSGFLLTSFHITEALLSAFLWLYTLGCAVVQEYHEMSFIYDYSGRVASWLATCTRNPKVPGSSLAATYAQR